jgi:plastocyanin
VRGGALGILAPLLMLAACGGTTSLPTPSASRPIVTSSTVTPGPNNAPAAQPTPIGNLLTPVPTPTNSQPTATALLTAVASSNSNQVRIVDFQFNPPTIDGTVGTAITWTNAGPSNHTVTATDGSFDSGIILVNAKFSFTPTAPGTFTYRCSIHPTMQGTIVVK